MKFTVNKSSFLENLLIPASKITENVCLNFVKEEEASVLKTTVCSADRSIVLMTNTPCSVTETTRCVIPDCKTFLRLFSGIENQDGLVTLEVQDNVVKYTSSTISFKFYLLDEFFLADKKSINEEKINSIPLDTKFTITKAKFSELLKFNSIIPDAEKLYFYTKSGKVYAKLGDEQKTNTNEITTDVSSKYEGEAILTSLPVNIQNLLLMNFSSDEINIAVNHELKIFVFSTLQMKYIVSGLVK